MPGRDIETNTLFFVHKHQIPSHKWSSIAHARIVYNVQPQKAETNRTRITYRGNNLVVNIDLSTPTADLITFKLLLNHVISTPGAKPEFWRMKIEYFLQGVSDHYNLKDKVDTKRNLYIRVEKDMYSLTQAGKIANKLSEKRLKKFGYTQLTVVPDFWKHEWRCVSFTLVVDNFGVKYLGEQHMNHLFTALRKFYVVDKNKKRDKYCGITLD